MLSPETLAQILRAPSESIHLDFKERLDWKKGKRAQLELIRDLACFANREGGTIIVGVRQVPGGRFEPSGLSAEDEIPDVTVVNVLSREVFSRPIGCEIQVLQVGERDFAVISVPEFKDEPFIAAREAVADGQIVIGRGDLIVRTDAMQCQKAGPAEFRQLIDRSRRKHDAAFARLVADTPTAPDRVASAPGGGFEREAFAKYKSLRAANFRPTSAIADKRLRELEELLTYSRIPPQGTALFPRYLTTYESDYLQLLRLPDALLIEAENAVIDSDERHLSAIRITRGCVVSVRESLWEDLRAPDQQRLDITTMVGFVYASLTFGHRFFRLIDHSEFDYEFGLLGPLGRTLWSDPGRWTLSWGSHIKYRATSPANLWFRRRLSTADVGVPDKRADISFGLIEELFDFFGFAIPRQLYDTHLVEVRTRWPQLDAAPPARPTTN